MTDGTINIRQNRIVEAKPFYADRTDRALKVCEDDKHQALYIPEILDARVGEYKENPQNAINSFIFQNWFKALSLRATGRTIQGKKVVVYAHVPNYFSKAKNITAAINKGLRNGAGELPTEEFQKLLDLQDDESVFVIDHEVLKNSSSGVMSVKEARKHPQTIPFCGGEKQAENYLLAHEKVYGENIGVWHSDDLDEVPRGRLLVVGNYYYGLFGSNDLDSYAHFLGVRSSTGGASAQKILPTQEGLTKIINDYVATINHEAVKNRIKALYN